MKKPTKKITAARSNDSGRKTSSKKPVVKVKPKKTTRSRPAASTNNMIQELSLLLNNTEESFVAIDTDLKIIVCNKPFTRFYNIYFKKDPKKGDFMLDYILPERKQAVKEVFLKVFAGEKAETLMEMPDAKGVMHAFSHRFKPICDENRTVIGASVISVDITHKREAERQMKEERMLLRTLIDNLPINVYTKDLDSKKTLANRTDYEYTGADSEGAVLGKDDFELFSEESAKITIAEDQHIFNTGKSILGKEEHHVKKDGSDIWFLISKIPLKNIDNEITGLLGISFNITERKEGEEKIRIAKERYDIVTKATNEAIWDWDLQSNHLHWGEGFRSLFGYDPDKELVTLESWTEHIHPEDEKRVINGMMKVVNSAKVSKWEEEYRFKKVDGSYANVLDRGFIMRNEHGKPTRMIGAMQDITKRKQSEIAIQELNQQLNKRAEELAASNADLEQFAYVASHDLQEPLRMVSSFLQLLQKKYNDQLDDTARQYISYAVDGSDRMKQLILDLLEYSRVGTNEDKHVKADINEVLTQVLETFDGKIKESGAVIKAQTLPSMRVNSTQITQLLQNLVGNALKYNTSPVAEVEIGCEEKKDTWQFYVKDNGIGIEPKFFDKVFVIFQRLHNKKEFSGTGIGLAICKKIVERHGGKIWIESTTGKGSTFFFTIKK